jgi:hypothetical protein
LVKAWNIREPLGDGEHPRSAAFLLEYKNIGSSFIARPADSVPVFDIIAEPTAEFVQLDEEESGSARTSGEGSSDSSSSPDSADNSEARDSSSTSSEEMPPRKNLIRDEDDDDVLLAQRSKKQKSASGAVATGSRSSTQELERKKREEGQMRERERRKEEEKKKVEDRKKVEEKKKMEERKRMEGEKEEERRKMESRSKAGQALVPVSALPEGASVAISPQLAPALLERAVLPADRQRALGSDQLALQASQRLALVKFSSRFQFSTTLDGFLFLMPSFLFAVCD